MVTGGFYFYGSQHEVVKASDGCTEPYSIIQKSLDTIRSLRPLYNITKRKLEPVPPLMTDVFNHQLLFTPTACSRNSSLGFDHIEYFQFFGDRLVALLYSGCSVWQKQILNISAYHGRTRQHGTPQISTPIHHSTTMPMRSAFYGSGQQVPLTT